MSRPVAIYSDPFEGLHAQLVEMRGLIKLVPPLIAADRQKRWDEIGSRPWDGEDDEIVDIYEVEAGPEEGHGWADYEYVVYQAAIVTSWETFHFYLTRQLARAALQYDLSDDPALAQLVVEERKTWDRRFDQVQKRFKDFLGADLGKLKGWERVAHAQELRNALVHNLGRYTERYTKIKDFRLPPADSDDSFVSTDPKDLINQETIPLDLEFTSSVINDLVRAGKVVDNVILDRNTKSPSS